MKKAIYLSGGGARGAYQVGVLQAVDEIVKSKEIPIQILSAVSAGAINAAYLAMHADNFSYAVSQLTESWCSLTSNQIFEASNLSLIQSVLRNFFSMSLHYKIANGGYLLDTLPLKNLLTAKIDFNRINDNVDRGLLSHLEIATTCYDTPRTVSFIKSQESLKGWKKPRHFSCITNIECRHILASSAIPLFFPSIKIDNLHYGDGSIRLNAPLRAAVKLGADRILVIGTRRYPTPDILDPVQQIDGISFGKILGNMFNALFLDNLDRDIEMLSKVNESLELLPPNSAKKTDWRKIEVLHFRPSIDLATLIANHQFDLSYFLRYLMNAFSSGEENYDLLSFLLFESAYTTELVELGYADAMTKKNEIEAFFLNPN